MHRTTRRLGLVAALTLGLAVAGPLVSVAAAAPSAAKADSIATLKVMKPSVSVQKKGAKKFKPATDGQQLHEGDVVKTDTTGLAEVDYSDDSYTRLDVSTTLKIVKLSDDQGNRQVETTVDVGRTWNRTAELTESQSFEQGGAGATAAIVGTAFAVECDAIDPPATVSHHCTTIGVIHTTQWTGADGTQHDLGPYETCDATDGVICDEPTQIAAFDEWIQNNIALDFLLRGLPGPLSGVVTIQGGHAIFIPTTTTITTATSPATPPNVLASQPIGCDGGCDQEGFTTLATGFPNSDYVAGSAIVVDENGAVDFVANLTVPTDGYSIVFDSVPDEEVGRIVVFCGSECETVVDTSQHWDADTIFTLLGFSQGTTGFSFHVEDAAGNHVGESGNVPVTVTTPTTSDFTSLSETTTPSTDPPTRTPRTNPPTTDPPSG